MNPIRTKVQKKLASFLGAPILRRTFGQLQLN